MPPPPPAGRAEVQGAGGARGVRPVGPGTAPPPRAAAPLARPAPRHRPAPPARPAQRRPPPPTPPQAEPEGGPGREGGGRREGGLGKGRRTQTEGDPAERTLRKERAGEETPKKGAEGRREVREGPRRDSSGRPGCETDVRVPGPSAVSRETDRGAGANGAVTCGRAQRQAGQKEGAVKKEGGQIGRERPGQGLRSREGREGERQRPRGSAGKGWRCAPSGPGHQAPTRQGCRVGRRATPRAEAAPMHPDSTYQARPPSPSAPPPAPTTLRGKPSPSAICLYC